MDARAWTLLVVLGAIWGASFMLTEIALHDLSPAAVTLARTAFAAAVMVPAALARGALRGLRPHRGALLAVAAIQLAGPLLLIAVAQEEVDSGLAGVLIGTTPIFTALLAVGLDQAERSRGTALLGVGIGLGGVALALGADLRGSGGELAAGALLLLAAVGYAAGGFIVKHRLHAVEPVGVVAAAMVAASVMLAPAAAIGAPSRMPGLAEAAAAIALGAVSGGVGWLLYYVLIARVGPARASISIYLVPAFAVVYGVALLGEPLTAGVVAGLVLIVTGSWLAASGPPPAADRPPERERLSRPAAVPPAP